MEPKRPNPDELLAKVVAEEKLSARGKLTIFFGAAPGVGKTYAMLEAARAAKEREHRDTVVGVVETHGRYETAALVQGLELLPRRQIEYRGVTLEEFDLDGALARKPALVLMDELAHTNAEGSRHPKRWQDVEELLDAGIDVFTTMNVQHVESLNDVIAKITGVLVRETVPDSMLEQAHEIKLVDLPPDALLERLREGKVYVSAQAQRAIENFFRKGNLIALRELALRHTAERVDAQMRAYRKAQGIEQTWAAADLLLVAVSPSPHSARLIRAARRMASSLHARWCAVYVETPRARQLPKEAQARLSQNLRLAQQLGAEVVTLSADDASEEIVRFARERNITQIIVGKPGLFRPWDRLRPSLVDKMVRLSGDIDVYMTAGDASPEERAPAAPQRARPHLPSYLWAMLLVLCTTGTAWLLFGRDQQLADVVMVYLLGIILFSARFALAPSLTAAFLSVAAFDYFFIPPYLTFSIMDMRHGVTFFVMFLVAVVISGQTQRIRNQAATARERESRTAALYALSHELSEARTIERVIETAASHLERTFASRVAVFTADAQGKLQRVYANPALPAATERDRSVSEWVWTHQQEAGLSTSTLPGGSALQLPLMASGGVVGVLSLSPEEPDRFDDLEQRRQIEAFATQMAMAMERAQLAEETQQARLQVETEQLRSSLLSSVSHDLRTPLAVITGAASTLVEGGARVDPAERMDLTETILDEAERLNRLIRNLLDMTRLESGAVKVKKEWMSLEEVVGTALDRMDARLAQREVRVQLPELPLLPFDGLLIEQVLINLLENAVKYSQGAIEISAALSLNEVVVEVADHGPGVPAGEELLVFDKFHRAVREHSHGGVGLGLAICRAIVAAHGGRIWVENRPEGGASFKFALPIEGEPPALPLPERTEPSEAAS
jgi:two-component system, OmpR family, sensor histidine kinase KdpD